MNKKIVAVAVAVAVMGCTYGCGNSNLPQGGYDNEIITTTPVDQDKTMITVRVEFGAGQGSELETVLEEKFPNVDIVLRHDGSTSSVYTIKADLEADVECDFIMSRRLPAVSDIADDYLLDLSGQDFVNNYYMNAVDSCATADGKLYYLPGPSDVYGIVYDKTLFDENGWELPHSYSEFVELINTIDNSGLKADDGETDLKAFQPSIMYPDAFQIFFNTYGYDMAYEGTENYRWLTEYQSGEGSMVGHMEGAVEKFKGLFEDGILAVSDMDMRPLDRSQMMYQEHSTAMIMECQNAVTYAETMASEAGITDVHDIAMMPFWISDEPDSDFLYVIPSYYMAINKKAADESSEKKQILLDIFEFLSSVEGQEILLDGGFQISNISGVPVVNNDFSENIIDTIERGRIINTFYFAEGETDKQVERQMLGTLRDMLLGDITVEEWLEGIDSVRDDYLAGNMNNSEVYGQSEETLTRLETAYTVAEMYRELTGADIGIVAGGGYRKSTNGYFYKGDITASSLDCITPNKEPKAELEDEMDEKICVAGLTGQQILDILNSDEGSTNSKGQYYYYVAAGLNVKFNPWADAGKRVISCKLPNGSDIDTDATYQVAFYYGSLPDENIKPESALSMTWNESFIKWLDDNGGVVKKPEMTLTLVYE